MLNNSVLSLNIVQINTLSILQCLCVFLMPPRRLIELIMQKCELKVCEDYGLDNDIIYNPSKIGLFINPVPFGQTD